jgi:phenylalanine-4-hydroxylase
VRFDLARVMRTHYRIDDFQETYFVLGNLDELLELARIDFAPFYEQAARESEFEPGQLLATDRIVSRGSGHYHAARRELPLA